MAFRKVVKLHRTQTEMAETNFTEDYVGEPDNVLADEQSMSLATKKAVADVDTPSRRRPSGNKKLPPDEYPDEIEPISMVINESNRLIFRVKRDKIYGEYQLDIRHYLTTERYTGYTKKAITIPLEQLYALINKCDEVSAECDKKKLDF